MRKWLIGIAAVAALVTLYCSGAVRKETLLGLVGIRTTAVDVEFGNACMVACAQRTRCVRPEPYVFEDLGVQVPLSADPECEERCREAATDDTTYSDQAARHEFRQAMKSIIQRCVDTTTCEEFLRCQIEVRDKSGGQQTPQPR